MKPSYGSRNISTYARRAIKKLASLTFTSAKYHGLWQIRVEWWKHRQTPPVLVYQMGKVGSSSVLHSLATTLNDVSIYHLHTLRPDHLAREMEVYRSVYRTRRKTGGYVLEGLFLSSRLKKVPDPHNKWRIVTLVRDPVARNISTFFQTLNLHFSDCGFETRIRAGDPTVTDDLITYFIGRFAHSSALTWFDQELKAIFGVDVLAESFEPGIGFRTYENDRARVLLLRLEDLDECAPIACRDFFGLQSFELDRKNLSAEKYYARVYREFVAKLVLPDALLETIYGSPFAMKFYSAEEIASFRNRWGARPTQSLAAQRA